MKGVQGGGGGRGGEEAARKQKRERETHTHGGRDPRTVDELQTLNGTSGSEGPALHHHKHNHRHNHTTAGVKQTGTGVSPRRRGTPEERYPTQSIHIHTSLACTSSTQLTAPHLIWFLTGVTAPWVVQSQEEGLGEGWGLGVGEGWGLGVGCSTHVGNTHHTHHTPQSMATTHK